MENIALDRIRIDGGTQPRSKIDTETVSEYAEHYRNKVDLPELIVHFDGKDYWLSDGFHRYHGAAKAGRTAVACAVVKGTQRDAILYSCGANHRHGLKRTNDDKRHAILALLNDEEWSKWSDRVVAERCKVSNTLVSQVRATVNIDSSNGESGEDAETVGKDGKKRKRSSAKRSAGKKKLKPAPAIAQAVKDDEAEPEKELSTADKCEADNKAIESFCRATVKAFEDDVPQTPWTKADGRIGSALSSVRAGCNTIRTAKAVICPQCEDGEDAKGNECVYCGGHGYLPKMKADQLSGVKS